MKKRMKGVAILSVLVIGIVFVLKFVYIGDILKNKIKENVEQEVEKI